jgi:hypothetical protein
MNPAEKVENKYKIDRFVSHYDIILTKRSLVVSLTIECQSWEAFHTWVAACFDHFWEKEK